jgi:hypothetical protein
MTNKPKKETKRNRQERINLANLYVKQNIWKRFLKYKTYEFGIIPLAFLTLWKVPWWIGWWVVKIFNIDVYTNPYFCNGTRLGEVASETTICDGVKYNPLTIWLTGFFVCVVVIIFVFMNWKTAKSNLLDEATTKFDVYYSELD